VSNLSRLSTIPLQKVKIELEEVSIIANEVPKQELRNRMVPLPSLR